MQGLPKLLGNRGGGKIDKRLGRQVQPSAGAVTTVDMNVNETRITAYTTENNMRTFLKIVRLNNRVANLNKNTVDPRVLLMLTPSLSSMNFRISIIIIFEPL